MKQLQLFETHDTVVVEKKDASPTNAGNDQVTVVETPAGKDRHYLVNKEAEWQENPIKDKNKAIKEFTDRLDDDPYLFDPRPVINAQEKMQAIIEMLGLNMQDVLHIIEEKRKPALQKLLDSWLESCAWYKKQLDKDKKEFLESVGTKDFNKAKENYEAWIQHAITNQDEIALLCKELGFKEEWKKDLTWIEAHQKTIVEILGVQK